MSGAEVRVESFDDFGFDERDVLPRLVLRLEVSIAFDPGARDDVDVRDFDERAARLCRHKDAFYEHRHFSVDSND